MEINNDLRNNGNFIKGNNWTTGVLDPLGADGTNYDLLNVN